MRRPNQLGGTGPGRLRTPGALLAGSLALVVALVLASCGDGITAEPPPAPAPPRTTQVGAGRAPVAMPPPTLRPDPASLPAADPRMPGFDGWPLRVRATGHRRPGWQHAFSIIRDGAPVADLAPTATDGGLEAVWDGTDVEGGLVTPGPLTLVAVVFRPGDAAGSARLDVPLEVMRLGVAAVDLAPAREADEEAAPGEARSARVPLLYRKTDGERRGWHWMGTDERPWQRRPDDDEGPGATALSLADGTTRPAPPPWDDLESPPLDPGDPAGIEDDTYNIPTAWVAGSRIAATATLAMGDGGTGPSARVKIRLAPPAGTSIAKGSAAIVAPAGRVTVVTDASPIPAVERVDLALDWRFEVAGADGTWVPMPGAARTTHRLYGLVAEPVFAGDGVPYAPWVDVVDTVAGWVAGATADPMAVAGAIVDGVYFGKGLVYDRERGADAYISFPGGWEGAVVDLSRFQDLANGTTVNCSDNAGIVGAYGNMMGIDLRYQIVRRNLIYSFSLHPTRPIGTDAFAASPFESGRAAFRFHAITELPPVDAGLPVLERPVFDSTLAVDGDDDPAGAPHTLQLVTGLTRRAYLSALSPQWEELTVFVDEKIRIE